MTGRGGVIIISKQDLIDGFRYWESGRNVGIHEFAHKIDGEDGYIDGVPLLLMKRRVLVEEWKRIRESESERIKRGESDIDSYALTNNAEFFAVVSEYFFTNPKGLYENHRQLYNILKRIFGIDTKSIITKVVKSMFTLK